MQAGSQGIGPVLTYDVSDWLTISAEGNFFSYSVEAEEIDDITYDGDLDLFSAGLSVTARPFYENSVAGGFKLVAGVFAVDNTVNLRATAEDNLSAVEVEIGEFTGLLDGDDAVNAEVGFDSIAPYVGLGWDWFLGQEDQVKLSLDVGVLFVGDPDVNVSVEGALAVSEDDIQAEEDSIREELEDVSIYPVVKLGLVYRF